MKIFMNVTFKNCVVFITSIIIAGCIGTTEVNVELCPMEVIYHDPVSRVVVRIEAVKGDDAYAVIEHFLSENKTGWCRIWKRFSLGETAPSLEIWAADRSFTIHIWPDKAVIGCIESDRSWEKTITDDTHRSLENIVLKIMKEMAPRDGCTARLHLRPFS